MQAVPQTEDGSPSVIADSRAAHADGPPDGEPAADRRLRQHLGRAWWIWAIAASAYLVAIFHRMALGVAGLDAAERFSVPQGSLAIFTSVQLALYLLMQVPAGLAADRLGPRRTLAIGLGLMAVGELIFAFATSMPVGLAGRALVGIGDALTFLNVLRLAHAWFPGRMQTLLAALTGFAGALGQLVSTVPLEAGLTELGWTPTFLVAGAVTAVLVLVPLTLVRDRPPHVPAPARHSHEPVLRTLVLAWRRPGTRHGFFLHMGALAPFTIVTAVWGVPYMVDAQGIGRGTAASYLLAAVLAFAAAGPTLGLFVGSDVRRQARASVLLPALSTVSWAVLLLWPGGTVPRPLLLLGLLATGFAAGGAMLAFEIARREAPPVATGSAGALVNCGGFSAAVLGSLAIGALIGPGGGSPTATQHAMLPVLLCAAIGLVGSAWLNRRPLADRHA